jgi:hypothetical protein
VTVDNCTTNDAMLRILLDKLPISSLMLGGSLLHMRCAAHILNLVVQDGLTLIGDGIEKIRDSVLFWTGSPKRRQKFDEIARQLHVPCTKELVLDCKTRWNSTYLMLSTALVYQDVFSRLKQRDSSYTSLPNERDWHIAKEICERLELFYNVIEIFSSTTYPTANMYFPLVCDLKIALSEWSVCSNELISKMASSMILKFDNYWSDINGIMGIAAILDPRYKMKLLEFYYPSIYGLNASAEIANLKRLCCGLLDEYGDGNEDKEKSSPMPTTSGFVGPSKSRFQSSLQSYDLFVSGDTPKRNESVRLEFDHYIDDGVLPRTENFDILTWWKSNGIKYPTLQKIARDILAIPVTTVASESAFSTSRRLLSPHRSRLHPKTIEALMCAQSWLWTEIKGDFFFFFIS